MKALFVVSALLAAVAVVVASPLAMWVSGDLPDAAEQVAPDADQRAEKPQPPPQPGGASSSHRSRDALVKPVIEGKERFGGGCSVSFDNALYTFGGAVDRTHAKLTNELSRYDQILHTWELVRRNRNTSPDAVTIDATAVAAPQPPPTPAAAGAGAGAGADAAPSPRYGHSCAIEGQNLLVFGGVNEYNEALDDLWQYNFLEKQWKQLYASKQRAAAAAKAGGPLPPPRPPKKGSKKRSSSEPKRPKEYITPEYYPEPCPRSGHVVVVDNTRRTLWVFGGRNSAGQLLNDLYCYDLHTGVWTHHLPPQLQVAPPQPLSISVTSWIVGPNAPATYPQPSDRIIGRAQVTVWPGAREQHSCIVDADNVMWCYGGVGYAADAQYLGTLSDVWTFPLSAVGSDQRWTYLCGSVHFAVNESPRYIEPEYVQTLENLPTRKQDPRYYRFKQQNENDDAEDAEEGTMSRAAAALLSIRSHHRARSSQKARASAVARARARASTKILPPSPGARYSPLLTYDKDANAVWLFGGRDARHSALNDLWAWRVKDRKWVPYHPPAPVSAATIANVARGVTGPLVWPPVYGGGYGYSAAVLAPGAQQMYVYGARPYALNHNDVWLVDLYGKGAFANGVDVCSSNPCAHGGACERTPDVLLGGGVGYTCRCPIGFTGRHCQVGEHLFRDINNPFLGAHPVPVSDLGAWKSIDDITKPYPIVEAFVPPKVAPPAPPLPVTVGPMYIPNTETRTVQLVRDPNAPPRDLGVELHPSLASDPRVIADVKRSLESTTRTIERVHHTVRRISNAPLVEHNGAPTFIPPPTPTPTPMAPPAAAADAPAPAAPPAAPPAPAPPVPRV